MPINLATRLDNYLLAGLPRKDRERLASRCERVDLVFGDVLCEAGKRFDHVHFPLSGSIALMVALSERKLLEIGLIGSEGMLGATLPLNVDSAPMRGVVQGAGSTLRMPRDAFQREMEASEALRTQLRRYLYVAMSQLARSAACTHFHETSPRLARWLLMSHDRARTDHFHLTHACLADMLGVRRSSISVAAAAMRRASLIEYSRGEITVLDRSALERAACPCYAADLADYERQFAQECTLAARR